MRRSSQRGPIRAWARPVPTAAAGRWGA